MKARPPRLQYQPFLAGSRTQGMPKTQIEKEFFPTLSHKTNEYNFFHLLKITFFPKEYISFNFLKYQLHKDMQI